MYKLLIIVLTALCTFLFIIVFMWAWLGADSQLSHRNHVRTVGVEESL